MATDLDDHDPYLPPEVDPRDVAILNAVYGRRQPVEASVAGMAMRIAPAWLEDDEPGLEHTPISLLIDNAPAELQVHTGLMQALFASLGPGLDAEKLSPEQSGLVLEFILRDALAQVESAARVKIAVLAAWQSEGWIQDSVTLRFAVTAPALGTSWCWLTLPRYMASKLAGQLGRARPPRTVVVNAQLSLALRIGHVTLTAEELRGLRAGDILVAEETCPPSTVAAVIAEHMTAPAELTPNGPRLSAALAPVARSRFKWSGDAGPPQPPLDAAAGSIPIRVFFELGRHVITVADLPALGPGITLPAVGEPDGLIDIVASGRRIGRGEPVVIGEGRGLRIARLTGHE